MAESNEFRSKMVCEPLACQLRLRSDCAFRRCGSMVDPTHIHADFLPPPGLEVVEFRPPTASDRSLLVTVKLAEARRPLCPACNRALAPNGVRSVRMWDVPHHNCPTALVWLRRRFVCRHGCGRSWPEECDEMDGERSVTRRLKTWIAQRVLDLPTGKVADLCGLGVSTVRRVFQETTQSSPQKAHVRVLGLTAASIAGHDRPVAVDVDRGSILEIYADTEDLLLSGLAGFSADFVLRSPGVAYAVAAGDTGAKFVTVSRRSLLNRAQVLIDMSFAHVWAETRAPRVERRLFRRRRANVKRHGLDRIKTWRNLYPSLHRAYEAKEAFLAIWEVMKPESEVRASFGAWKNCFLGQDDNLDGQLAPLCRLVDEDESAIFLSYRLNMSREDARVSQIVAAALDRLTRKRNFEAAYRLLKGWSYTASDPST
jgi:hypothetical protein